MDRRDSAADSENERAQATTALRRSIQERCVLRRGESLEHMERKFDEVVAENDALKDQLQSLEKQNFTLQTEVGVAKGSVQDLTIQLEQAKTQPPAPKTMWKAAGSNLMGKIAETKLLNQVEDMEQEFLEEKTIIVAQAEELSQEVTVLHDQIEALNETIRLKDVELGKAQQALEDARDEKMTLEQEVHMLKQRLDNQQEELVDVHRKSTALTVDGGMMMGSLAFDLLEDHDGEVERLQEEKEKEHQQVEDLQKQNDKLKEKAHGARFATVALQAVKEGERSGYIEEREAAAEAKHESAELAAQCQVYKDEAYHALVAGNNYEAALEEQRDVSQEAAERGMILWEEAQEFGKIHVVLQESLTEAQSSNEHLQKQNADWQAIVVRLSKQSGGLERELAEMLQQGNLELPLEEPQDASSDGEWQQKCAKLEIEISELRKTEEAAQAQAAISETRFQSELEQLFAELKVASQTITEEKQEASEGNNAELAADQQQLESVCNRLREELLESQQGMTLCQEKLQHVERMENEANESSGNLQDSEQDSKRLEELTLEYEQMRIESTGREASAADEIQKLREDIRMAQREFLEEQRRADAAEAAGENSEAVSQLSLEYQELFSQAQVIAEQGYQELQAAQMWREQTEEEAWQVVTLRKEEVEQAVTLGKQTEIAVEAARQEVAAANLSRSSDNEKLESVCEEYKQQAGQRQQELQSCQERLEVLSNQEITLQKLESEQRSPGDAKLADEEATARRCADLQKQVESALQAKQEFESSAERASSRSSALEQECIELRDQVSDSLEKSAADIMASSEESAALFEVATVQHNELKQEYAILSEVVESYSQEIEAATERSAELEQEVEDIREEVVKETQRADVADETCLKVELAKADAESECEKLQSDIVSMLEVERQCSEKVSKTEEECARLRAQQSNQVVTDELRLMNETLEGDRDLWKLRAEQFENSIRQQESLLPPGRTIAELLSESSSLENQVDRARQREMSESSECKALLDQTEKTAKLEAAAQSSLESCKRERLLVQNQVVGDVANRCAMLRDQCERAMQAERHFRENAEMSVELRGLIGNLRKRMGDST